MQFGGIIYLHHPYQSLGWNDSRGENVMRLSMKLSDPEMAPRVILGMVGPGENGRNLNGQLKDTTWRNVQTRQFTNTKDSAWSIVDTLLGISPIISLRVGGALGPWLKQS